MNRVEIFAENNNPVGLQQRTYVLLKLKRFGANHYLLIKSETIQHLIDFFHRDMYGEVFKTI
jgi:hypothetical protein